MRLAPLGLRMIRFVWITTVPLSSGCFGPFFEHNMWRGRHRPGERPLLPRPGRVWLRRLLLASATDEWAGGGAGERRGLCDRRGAAAQSAAERADHDHHHDHGVAACARGGARGARGPAHDRAEVHGSATLRSMRRLLLALLAWHCCTTTAGAGWAQLADEAHSPPDFAFQWMAWDDRRGVIWTNNPGGVGGTWKFDAATNVWSMVLPAEPSPPGLRVNPPPPAQGTSRHNCGFVYDSKRDLVFISACAPSPDANHWAYNPATNAWTDHGRNTMPGSDVALAYDPVRDHIIGLGGWGRPGSGTWHKHQAAGLGAPYVLVDNLPPELAADLKSDPGKETMNRSAWDSKRNEMWYVQTSNSDLWIYNPAVRVWTKHVTTGPKPPPYTVFGYDPVHDVIVGWTGCNGWDCADIRGQTWLLNRATLVWSMAERASTGDPVPPPAPYQTHVMLWDTVRQQMILRTGLGGMSNQGPTWRYTMGAAPPPHQRRRRRCGFN
jgi:hypothetical protein